MSYTSVGRNKVYASIEDLPENQKLVDGDRIIIQSSDGTALVDFENVKIDLEHTTFSTQITQLIEFTSTVEQYLDELQTDISNISTETASMKTSVSTMEAQMKGCELLFKLILGFAKDGNDEYIKNLVNMLPPEGLEFYEKCLEGGKTADPNFSFTKYNLVSV